MMRTVRNSNSRMQIKIIINFHKTPITCANEELAIDVKHNPCTHSKIELGIENVHCR
jgi:hypothetical protein